MNEPSYLSLPSAAALPVLKLNLPKTAKRRLLKNGIVSALQLAEIASRSPRRLRQATGMTATKARRVLEAELGALPDFTKTATSFEPIPAAGVISAVAARSDASPAARKEFLERVREIDDLPTKVTLSKQMQPVGNQGPFGTCVGWSSNAVREYALQSEMSPGYAYRGAKSRDGHPELVGSWLQYAMEHLFLAGHVAEADYPYRAAVRGEPIGRLSAIAADARSIGFASLKVSGARRGDMPKLMRALLAGRLDARLSAQPIAVSTALYESFVSTSTALDGLIPMPFPEERPMGGHAMVVVGYVDAADQSNPFGLSYFIVRNSWGAAWAGENPFNEPGHALIPEAYFDEPSFIPEAYVCLGA